MKSPRAGLRLGPELPETPRGEGGGPLRGEPTGSAHGDGGRPDGLSTPAGPIVGQRRRIADVDMVEMTFVYDAPQAESVLLHLANITDRHRSDLRPSLLEQVTNGTWAGTFWLPADAILSYRFADVTGLPADVGSRRPGWKSVHERGRPDPRQPDRISTPLGGDASVWTGPDAPWTPPHGPEPAWVEVDADGVRARVTAGDDRVVVLFDGQFLAGVRLGAAVRERGLTHTLVTVDTGTFEERAAVLTDAGQAARLVAAGLSAASGVLGRGLTQADAIAGQSLGGLAVAAVLAEHPRLARTGIVQSGSFWWRRGEPDFAEPGDLVQAIRGGYGDVSTPVAIQVGTEEDELRPQARFYRDALLGRNAPAVGYREVRGGHDYAWWRHGIASALQELEGVADTAKWDAAEIHRPAQARDA